MSMRRGSNRSNGVFLALARHGLSGVCLAVGLLAAAPGAAAAGKPEVRPRPKLDCRSLPAGAPVPAGCRKSGGDADGDKVPDAVDRCPAAAEDRDGFQDEDGCPDPDNDGDGLLDEEDGCPLEAEDRDGFKDADGCPEPDNDGDGVLDVRDICPLEPESFDGSGDGDGCPDLLMVGHKPEAPPPPPLPMAPERPPTRPAMPPAKPAPTTTNPAPPAKPALPARPAPPVATTLATATSVAEPARPAALVTSRTASAPAGKRCPDGVIPSPGGECYARLEPGSIQISETIQFARDTDKLLEASHPILDQVVDILDSHPELRIMIVGHADGRGGERHNLRLSMMRALTVRTYLLSQSNDPQKLSRRLQAVGIGSRQPIDKNDSAVGRARNRRVEFIAVGNEPPSRAAPAAAAPAAQR